MEAVKDEFIGKAIEGQAKLLAITEREKLIAGVTSVVTFVFAVVTLLAPWPAWIVAMAGLTFGWFAARYLVARRIARGTAMAIARLREI